MQVISPKRILVVRNDRFGEFLLNIPALRALKETFPGAAIVAVVSPAVGELAGCIPFINEIIEWGQERHTLAAKIRFLKVLKKKNIDIAIMLNPSKDFNLLTYLAGIPVRVGYARKCGFLLTHKIKDRKHLAQKHEVEYNLELVRLIGAETTDRKVSLSIPYALEEGIPKCLSIGSPDNAVALHPWTSDPVKQWPFENFRSLAERLMKELEAQVVIVGGKEELPRSRELFDGLGTLCVNLTGKTTLMQLAAVLKKCRVLISGDSGPMHLSAAVGRPVVALFRNDIPGKSARRWGPWGEGHTVIEKSGLRDISVNEVFGKIKEVLRK